MNFKTTYGLFAVLIVVLGLAAWALLTGPKPGDEGLLLPGAKALKIEAKDIDTLTIERKKPQAETLVFTRLGERKWKLEKPFEARADSIAVEQAISDLLTARRENKEGSKNLADLGLDNPSLVVTLGRSGGQSYTVSLGNMTLGGASAEV